MMDAEGPPYGGKDVLDGLLQAGVQRDGIEALGVRERKVDWEVTLKSTAARNRLVQLQELEVKGKTALVNGIKKAVRRLRVFYLPFYVPISVITQQLVRLGTKVTKYPQDTDRETGLLSNVWNVLIEADIPECVPDRMRWSHDGLIGSVLINMIGKPPKCLRCSQRGHKKFECTAPYCFVCRRVGHLESDGCPVQTYAARVSGNVAADEEDMDDYGDVGETATATRQPPAASQSWAEQMDEARAAAAEAIVTGDEPATAPATAEQEPARPDVAEQKTPATTAAPESVDSPAQSPYDWTVQEGHKRRNSASPRKSGKVKATVTTKPATNIPRNDQATNPVAGRQRTQPMAVPSRRRNSGAVSYPLFSARLLGYYWQNYGNLQENL